MHAILDDRVGHQLHGDPGVDEDRVEQIERHRVSPARLQPARDRCLPVAGEAVVHVDQPGGGVLSDARGEDERAIAELREGPSRGPYLSRDQFREDQRQADRVVGHVDQPGSRREALPRGADHVHLAAGVEAHPAGLVGLARLAAHRDAGPFEGPAVVVHHPDQDRRFDGRESLEGILVVVAEEQTARQAAGSGERGDDPGSHSAIPTPRPIAPSPHKL